MDLLIEKSYMIVVFENELLSLMTRRHASGFAEFVGMTWG
jgi:hypothetical protein